MIKVDELTSCRGNSVLDDLLAKRQQRLQRTAEQTTLSPSTRQSLLSTPEKPLETILGSSVTSPSQKERKKPKVSKTTRSSPRVDTRKDKQKKNRSVSDNSNEKESEKREDSKSNTVESCNHKNSGDKTEIGAKTVSIYNLNL